jgi:hypothetical protein
MRYLLVSGLTALVTFLATTLYDENVTSNEFFHVLCECPKGGAGAVYGPGWKVTDADAVGDLVIKFCIDVSPLLSWDANACKEGLPSLPPKSSVAVEKR